MAGDAGVNNVSIIDLGNGRVAVLGDGQFRVLNNVDTVFVSTLGGNDTVRYFVSQPSSDGSEIDLAVVDTGDGNDTLIFNAVRLTQSMTFFGLTGAGNDTIVAATADVAAGEALTLSLNGGTGTDDISLFGTGEIDGDLNVRLVGTGGNDTILGEFVFETGSTGTATIRENGGAGDDDLTLDVSGDGLTTIDLDAAINGSVGTDTSNPATTTTDVVVVNVP